MIRCLDADATPESSWTIVKLAPTFSFLTCWESVFDSLVARFSFLNYIRHFSRVNALLVLDGRSVSRSTGCFMTFFHS